MSIRDEKQSWHVTDVPSYQILGHVCIVAKTNFTNILVIAKTLVFDWMVANYLVCQCPLVNLVHFFINIGQHN
jgi:hypothetical protein